MRAVALAREGKAREAAAIYSEILASNPADTGAMAGRTRALLAADLWKDALTEARRFEARAASSAEVRAALAEALLRSGQIDRAGAEAASLMAGGGGDSPPPHALLVLGLVRAAQGREDEGVRLLDRALAAAPEDPQILFHAAGAAPTRAGTIEILERYLASSRGDDPDRIESAKGTIRTCRVLGERAVWVPANRPESLDLQLFPLPGERGRPSGYTIDAVVGEGKAVRLLLDSGASGLLLLERIARKRGFVPLGEETAYGGGGVARHAIQTGIVPSVALGDLRFTDALVTSSAEEIEATGRYAGIVGLDVFRDYRVTLDFRRGRLILDSPAAEMGGSPYWLVGGKLLVEAEIPERSTGLFVLDTGASASLLSIPFAESALGAAPGRPVSVRGFGGALAGARNVRGARVRFQGLESPGSTLPAVDLSLQSRLTGVEISGYLGLDLLDRVLVTIDPRVRRVAVVRPEKR